MATPAGQQVAQLVKVRAKGVGEAVLAYVAAHPASTIKEVQAGLPELPAASVEANVRALAGKGALAKDESIPRRFSVPAPAPEPVAEPKPEPSNGHRSNGVNSKRAAAI